MSTPSLIEIDVRENAAVAGRRHAADGAEVSHVPNVKDIVV